MKFTFKIASEEMKTACEKLRFGVLDGELRETQTADYFSSLCPIDCTVPSLNA